MKIILVGASGTIGQAVRADLSQRHEVLAVGRRKHFLLMVRSSAGQGLFRPVRLHLGTSRVSKARRVDGSTGLGGRGTSKSRHRDSNLWRTRRYHGLCSGWPVRAQWLAFDWPGNGRSSRLSHAGAPCCFQSRPMHLVCPTNRRVDALTWRQTCSPLTNTLHSPVSNACHGSCEVIGSVATTMMRSLGGLIVLRSSSTSQSTRRTFANG